MEKERVVVGYCKECGKQEDQDKFEQEEGHHGADDAVGQARRHAQGGRGGGIPMPGQA